MLESSSIEIWQAKAWTDLRLKGMQTCKSTSKNHVNSGVNYVMLNFTRLFSLFFFLSPSPSSIASASRLCSTYSLYKNKCPFKKFKLPECNLVLLTDIWPERKISHRINKVDQDQVKQQQSKREGREDDFERWDFDLAQVTIWQIVPAYKNLFKATEEFIFLCHGHF